MKKRQLIPKSMGVVEARKMLSILSRSTLPSKPELIAALETRAKLDLRGGEINAN